MTITQAQLNAEINTNLPTTGGGAINAAIMRQTLTDMTTAMFQSGNATINVTTIANIKAIVAPGGIAFVLGYYTSGDGGGGIFWWNAGDSTADNGGTIIAPNIGTGRWRKIYSRKFRAVEWGCKGDNATDNWPFLQAFRDFVRGDPGPWELTFDPGTYLYSKNYWVKGINDLTINASGATLHCNSTDPFDFNKWDFIGNSGVFEPWGYNNYSTATNFGSLIQSAAANSTAVTCLTVSQAGNFAAGNRVLIWGFGTQNAGFPPNPRYFEWNKVVSANPGTGVITLAYPLRNSYDQNWHAYAFDGTGPPYITNLSRTDFTQCSRLVVNGGYFGTGTVALNISASVSGYDYMEFNEVGFDNFSAGICGRVILNNCILLNGEPDKIVRSLEIVGGQIQNVQAYTGYEEVVLRGDVVVLGQNSFFPHRLIVDGAHFSSSSTAEAALIRVGVGWASIGIDIRQARFTVWDSLPSALIEAGTDTLFTISSVISNTKVLVSCANDTAFETIYQQLRIGFTYQLSNGSKRVRIKKIYDADASHVAIEGQWTDVPVGGEVYHGSTIQHINVGDIVQDGPFAPLPILLNNILIQSPQFIHQDARDRFSETLLFSYIDVPVPPSGGGNSPLYIPIRGWIRRIVINVSKAYNGADVSSRLIITDAAFTNYVVIDTKTMGIRHITPYGSEGAVGNDNLNLTVFGGLYFDKLLVFINAGGFAPTYTDPVQLAKFSIHIETQKEP